jgi:hypothetical protein
LPYIIESGPEIIGSHSSHQRRILHLDQQEYFSGAKIRLGRGLLRIFRQHQDETVIRQYIKNQSVHHQSKTWTQEEKEYQLMISNLLQPFRRGR